MAGRASPAMDAAGHIGRGLLAFAGLALVNSLGPATALGRFDQAVVERIGAGRNPAVVAAARALSALAEPESAALAMTAAGLIAARRAGWGAAGWGAAVVPSAALLGGSRARRVLSRAIARQRPPEANWLIEPEGFSLPSKHTTVAALTAGACAACLGAGGQARHGIVLVAAAGIGASRVYLGVHWPTDVLAGWLFAAGWLELADAAHDVLRLLSPSQG